MTQKVKNPCVRLYDINSTWNWANRMLRDNYTKCNFKTQEEEEKKKKKKKKKKKTGIIVRGVIFMAMRGL